MLNYRHFYVVSSGQDQTKLPTGRAGPINVLYFFQLPSLLPIVEVEPSSGLDFVAIAGLVPAACVAATDEGNSCGGNLILITPEQNDQTTCRHCFDVEVGRHIITSNNLQLFYSFQPTRLLLTA